jgi:hypothetical protein
VKKDLTGTPLGTMLANAARYLLAREANLSEGGSQAQRLSLALSEDWNLHRLYTEMESRTKQWKSPSTGEELWTEANMVKARMWIAAYAQAETLETLTETMTKGGVIR